MCAFLSSFFLLSLPELGELHVLELSLLVLADAARADALAERVLVAGQVLATMDEVERGRSQTGRDLNFFLMMVMTAALDLALRSSSNSFHICSPLLIKIMLWGGSR